MRTRTRVRPGGARGIPPESPEQRGPIGSTAQVWSAVRVADRSPLVAAAGELLSLLTYFGQLPKYEYLEKLRLRLEEEIKSFVGRCRAAGRDLDEVNRASYLVCTFADEVVTSTPWGDASVWHERSLLMTFHGDVMGGDRCFDEMLVDALATSQGNRGFLELFYVCLSFGFKGRYYAPESGHHLERFKEQIYQLLADPDVAVDHVVSERWQSDAPTGHTVARLLPLWVVAVATVAVLGAGYLGVAWALHAVTDPVYEKLATLGGRDLVRRPYDPVLVEARPPAPTAPPLPEPALPPSPPPIPIAERWLFTFDVGEADVAATQLPRLLQLAEGLRSHEGLVVEVVGRTDFTGPPAVNERLSRERAEAVRRRLGESGLRAERFERVVGISAREPLEATAEIDFKAINRSTEVRVRWGD